MLIVLAAAVSGSLAPALQGIAWIEMAQEAGGLHRMGEAMFELSPCERCHAATALSHGSENDSDRPNPNERQESHRFFATIGKDLALPKTPFSELGNSFPRTISPVSPRSWDERPPIPPPRFGAIA